MRHTGMSLLITAGIMLSLGVLAAMHRANRPATAVEETVAGSPTPGTGAVTPMSFAGNNGLDVNPLDPPKQGEWEVLPGCRLTPNKTNAAHHFHVRTKDDTSLIFELYCAESPEPAAESADDLAEIAEYFGLAGKEQKVSDELTTLADEATRGVQRLLADQPFHVLTKWERKEDTHHFYAFIWMKDEHGQPRFLQDWLVERGWAMVTHPPLKKLPNGCPMDRYSALLDDLRTQAQRTRQGAWGVGR